MLDVFYPTHVHLCSFICHISYTCTHWVKGTSTCIYVNSDNGGTLTIHCQRCHYSDKVQMAFILVSATQWLLTLASQLLLSPPGWLMAPIGTSGVDWYLVPIGTWCCRYCRHLQDDTTTPCSRHTVLLCNVASATLHSSNV